MTEDEQSLRRELEKKRRQVERIESSFTYRLAKIISYSGRPFYFVGKKVLGRRAKRKYQTPESKLTSLKKTNDCMVFFPTNGVGFGHFTRLLAIARRVKKYSPTTEIIFFTTASTLHISEAHGFTSYRIPGRYRFDDGPDGATIWNTMVEEHLGDVLDRHLPKLIVFDGATPYNGLLDALARRPWVKAAWVRRGMHKKGTTMPNLEMLNQFEILIHPGDAIPDAAPKIPDGWNGEIIECEPIIYADESDLLPREVVRRQWGINESTTIVYISLGAGNINDIGSEINNVLDELEKYPDTIAVIGESLIGERIETVRENIRILRDYPAMRYARGFDFAIIAGGYNSYHEMIHFGIPTICIPNTQTKTGDQVARANANPLNKVLKMHRAGRDELSIIINEYHPLHGHTIGNLEWEPNEAKNGAEYVAKKLNNPPPV